MKNPLTIEAPERAEPGEPFEGTVGWQLADAPASAVLRVVWRTAGEGVTDEHEAAAVEVSGLPAAGPRDVGSGGPYRGVQPADALAPGPLRPIDVRRFRLRAPPSPPSFRGRLVRLEWRLELVVDGATLVRRLVISPTSGAIELP